MRQILSGRLERQHTSTEFHLMSNEWTILCLRSATTSEAVANVPKSLASTMHLSFILVP
jgi:hypothetical protein